MSKWSKSATQPFEASRQRVNIDYAYSPYVRMILFCFIVCQYNPFGDLSTLGPDDNRRVESNGSLIAVGYEARASGVKRSMRGYEAKRACPGLKLVQVY